MATCSFTLYSGEVAIGVAGSPTLEESYLSKKGGDPRTDQVTQGADSELPGWQPKEKEA